MATPADPVLPATALPPDAVSLVPIPPQRIPEAVAKLGTIIDDVADLAGPSERGKSAAEVVIAFQRVPRGLDDAR